MNEFQLNLFKLLVDLVSPVRLGDIVIEMRKGPNEATIEIRLTDISLSFWVYVDGAQIIGSDLDSRYEVEDYDSLDGLRESFLKEVQSYIASVP